MYLHVPTILFLTVLVALLTGVLLIFSWAQNRSHRSFAWWGVANLLANALLFLGYGAIVLANRFPAAIRGRGALAHFLPVPGPARLYHGQDLPWPGFALSRPVSPTTAGESGTYS
jgi:hypothetical protein